MNSFETLSSPHEILDAVFQMDNRARANLSLCGVDDALKRVSTPDTINVCNEQGMTPLGRIIIGMNGGNGNPIPIDNQILIKLMSSVLDEGANPLLPLHQGKPQKIIDVLAGDYVYSSLVQNVSRRCALANPPFVGLDGEGFFASRLSIFYRSQRNTPHACGLLYYG